MLVAVYPQIGAMASTIIDPMTFNGLSSGKQGRHPVAQIDLPLMEPGLIVTNAQCGTKRDAVKQAVALLSAAGRIKRPHELERTLLQRENISSTGFGDGFAIPHCKSSSVLANSLAILKLETPVDWEALDRKPVSNIIVIVIREADQVSSHLTILSQLARNLMDESFRKRIASETDSARLCAFLQANLTARSPITNQRTPIPPATANDTPSASR